jgi:surface carbohydrate biosynthesis protein
MNIYVLTEIYNREYPQLNLLLNSLPSPQPCNVRFADQSVFNERFKFLPVSNSAILIKDLQAIRRPAVRAYKKFSNKVFVYDIESLLIFGVDRFIATRIDEELLSIIDIYFVPTKYLYDLLAQRFPRFVDKFRLASSPKVIPYTSTSCDSISPTGSSISKIYVVSNFATLFPRTQSQDSIDNFLLSYSSPGKSIIQLIKQTNRLYDSYLQYSADLLSSIFLKYVDVTFYYRPHPFENIFSSNHFLFTHFPNVIILDNKESFYSQSKSCDLIISSMSTVSIELASCSSVPILELSPPSEFFALVETPFTHAICDHVVSSMRCFDRYIASHPNYNIIHANAFASNVVLRPSIWESLFEFLQLSYVKKKNNEDILFTITLMPFAFLAIARSLIAQMFIVKTGFRSSLPYNPAMKNPLSYLLFGSSVSIP